MSQSCALCGGPTERREILPSDRSNWCPKCRVFTADSDGHEAERRESIRRQLRDMAWGIVLRRRAAEVHST